MSTIFIQIASYRDPQLIPTLEDLLDNADNPQNLHICIAHQFSEEDEWDVIPDELQERCRFTIIPIPYKEAQGACWARNQIQQKYDGETYTFQLDSHHRFIKGWDTELIQMFQGLVKEGYKKPLITSYIPSFDPSNDPQGRIQTPWGMAFDRIIPEGAVFFLPYYMEEREKPKRGRFYSAHFAFTWGEFCKEVPHDPNFYFHGEEISIAVRSYTWGYDIFHPHKVIAWHEYTRVGRTKQWDDDTTWIDRNNKSHQRNRYLFGVDGETAEIEWGEYGFGPIRSLQDWEEEMGIRFKDRSIQSSIKQNGEPKKSDEPFHSIFRHPIEFDKNRLTHNDYEWFAVIYEDKNGIALHRRDEQNVSILNQPHITIWEEYQGPRPYKWIVWPYSKSKGWVDKIETII
jgi:hypothetical protein